MGLPPPPFPLPEAGAVPEPPAQAAWRAEVQRRQTRDAFARGVGGRADRPLLRSAEAEAWRADLQRRQTRDAFARGHMSLQPAGVAPEEAAQAAWRADVQRRKARNAAARARGRFPSDPRFPPAQAPPL